MAFMTLGISSYSVSALKSSLNYFLDSSLAALTSVALFGLSTIHPDSVTLRRHTLFLSINNLLDDMAKLVAGMMTMMSASVSWPRISSIAMELRRLEFPRVPRCVRCKLI